MPRPLHQVDQYRDFITQKYNSGVSRRKIQELLRTKYNIDVSPATLSARFTQWGLQLQKQQTTHSPELIERIKDCIFRIGLTDKQILIVIRREGFTISINGLQQIRLARGWKRRIDDPEERLERLNQVAQTFNSMAEQSNAVLGYGRRMLPAFIRCQARLNIPREPLYEVYRIMFPDAVDMRQRAMRRNRGHFLVPGPNYQWCLDGHDKLKDYGFEIYAAIDAWSRNIIWLYMGHSNATALSVLKQYLRAVEQYGIRPWFLQTDLGTETPLVAAAHWNFALRAGGSIQWKDQVFEQGTRLKDSFKTAPSTKNNKIEKMWESMLHCSSREWVGYFGELRRDGDFDREQAEDQIALYAVYEDILREELKAFVNTWNFHKIRLQRKRPHVIHGQPHYNYHAPDPAKACNWGIPIDQQVLQEMSEPIQDINLGSCLSPETKQWCQNELDKMGIAEARLGHALDSDRFQPFKRFYLALRDKIILHFETGNGPELGYRRRPVGGIQGYVSSPS